MVKNSLKQLLRSPGKAVLFLLLICASTVLIILGAGMCMRSFQQIQAAEDEFITVGWVTQNPISETETLWNDPCTGMRLNTETAYGPKLLPEDLMFEGANYIRPPETRPIYVAYMPDLNFSSARDIPYHEAILEFRALEGRDDGGPVEVEITRILYQAPKGIKLRSAGILDPAVYGVDYLTVEVGDTITFCQHGKDIEPYPVEAGKTYVANLQWAPCSKHRDEKSGDIWADEFRPIDGACSSQHDKEGNAVETELFPSGLWNSWHHFYWFQEVTEDFYEPGHAGIAWLNSAKQKEEGMFEHIFAVLGANSLELLPSYYDRRLVLDDGRWISQKEFDSGAPVCMMSRDVATANGYRVGDRINLSLLVSIYNHSLVIDELTTFRYFNLINAQGETYAPFWDQEYEIAGIFYCTSGSDYLDTSKDMFIIPEKSVKASDENNIAEYKHMRRWSTSFQIPNGAINEFDEALRAAVPGAEDLEIDYDDKGYTQVVGALRKALYMGFLLLGGGIFAVAAVVALLMYFFVSKERKRTAVERSLGLTKRQCRVSLLAGIMLMTLLGTAVGSGIGYVLLQEPAEAQTAENGEAEATPKPAPQTEESAELTEEAAPADPFDFLTTYSLWAPPALENVLPEIEAEPLPVWLYFGVPGLLCLAVLALGMVFVGRNLKVEPIYLLSVKE